MARVETDIRLADLILALSLATDLGLGQPMNHALRSARIAVRLGRAFGLDESALSDAYYLALLMFIGCSSVAGPTQRSSATSCARAASSRPCFSPTCPRR
jgi:hypothetical protein